MPITCAKEERLKEILIETRDFIISTEARVEIAWDINCGLCDYFAELVNKRFPDAEILWESDIGINMDEHSHCFLFFNGKYYDAECIEGVKNGKDLPCFGHNPRPTKQNKQ